MYEDTEDASASDTDTKDFFNALALLHSTDNDSADKLRKMLDASIEKKLGFDKTLRARVPKRSYRNTKPRRHGGLLSVEKSEKQEGKLRKNDNAPRPFLNAPSIPVNNAIKNDWGRMRIFDAQPDTESNGKPVKTLDNTARNNYKLFESFDEEEIEVDDSNEIGNIPRISIPDEGSGDGLFCKVCNGPKLGPLILLECQDCQEAYHPLCHQPPVVDVDVYDPRIVWHCNNCIDTVSTNRDTFSNEKTAKKFYRRGDANKTKGSPVNVDQLVKTKESLSQHDSTSFERTSSDTVRETDGSTSSNNNQATKNLSSNQLKKRIGSKLSVARAVTKQS